MTTALLLKIGAESAELRSDLNKANGMVSQFIGKMDKAGGAIAGALSVGVISHFVWEVSELAAKAEGVTSAFKKLPESTALLQDMQDATEGTVDKLTLMKIGVNAFNNKAPLENLAEILNFIDRTADATDQDFKSLADTMVNNIGKESTKGLNQLGLNIQVIKEKSDSIGFVPALMEEIRRKSAELGEVASEEADRVDRLAASWTDYKLSIGQAANETGTLGTSLTVLTDILDGLSGKNKVEFNANDLAVFIREDIDGKIKDAIENLKELREEAGSPLKIDVEGAIRMWELNSEQAEKFRDTIAKINGTLSQTEIKNNRIKSTVEAAFASGNVEAYIKALDGNIYKSEIIAEIRKRQAAQSQIIAEAIENEKNLTEQLNQKKEESLLLMGSARAKINDEIKGIEEKIKKLRELTNAEKGSIHGVGRVSSGIQPIKTPDVNTRLLAKQVQPIDQFTQALKFLNDQWMLTETSLRTGQETMMSFSQAWAQVGIAGIDATALINQGLTDTAIGIGAAIGQMMSGVGGMEQIGAALLGGIAGMLGQLGQLAIATGIAIGGIKKALMTLKPGVAIAAGVALIALSKMVSNKAAALGGAGGGGSSGSGGSRPGGLTKIEYGDRMEITGEFIVSGNNLIAAIDNETRRQNRTIPR